MQGPAGQIPSKGGIQVQWAQVRWEGTHLELLEEGKCRHDVGRAGWAPGLPVSCSLVCEVQTTVVSIHRLY